MREKGGENSDTSVDIVNTRYRAGRGQNTLNVELGLVTDASSAQAGAQTGGGGGVVGGAGVVTDLTGGTSSGGASCPEMSQFTLVWNEMGKPIPTLVACVEIGFYLWNPITRGFEKVIKADVIRNVDLIQCTSDFISASGSVSHPLIHDIHDNVGTPLGQCEPGLDAAFVSHFALGHTRIATVVPGGKGDVKHLETEGPTHIYAAGSTPYSMFIFHNLKPQGGPEN